MNKLILIGNGFDLAHGMKTSYKDFLIDFLRRCANEALDKKSHSSSDFRITSRFGFYETGDIKTAINDPGNWQLVLNAFSIDEVLITTSVEKSQQQFDVQCLNPVLKKAINSCLTLGWVDIEQIYYDELIRIASSDTNNYDRKLNTLNSGIESIKKNLHDYLKKLPEPPRNKFLYDVFAEPFNESDFLKGPSELDRCDHILILNFNYTYTPDLYMHDLNPKFANNPLIDSIHIHGELYNVENPLIFGFGDEMDDHYKILEKKNDNRFLDNMKSFGYFRTDNLRRLSRFLMEGEYQVQIMGHSCGLSDRVMLNGIFEHDNCRSIKIFHRRRGSHLDETNYKELTQNISRHFNKNKE